MLVFGFLIKGFSITASFRIPESHTFQQTLPLPPVTTLIGLMGAAMGLSFEEVMAFKEKNRISFGVIGSTLGEMRDLWKYNKVKTSEIRKDILIREYLTDFSLFVGIFSEQREDLIQIRNSFCNPKYALTLGNSDDLLKITYISGVVNTETCQCAKFENTILPGNMILEYESAQDITNLPITYKVRAPQVFLLPVSFDFNETKRKIKERREFTFVGSPIRLKKPIFAHKIEEYMFVLI